VAHAGTYADARGCFSAVFTNDGETIGMSTLGVTFSGWDFCELTPAPGTPAALLDGFTFADGALDACDLSLEMSLPIIVDRAPMDSRLKIELTVNRSRVWPDYRRLTLTLACGDLSIGASIEGRRASFEDVLQDLARALPAGMSIRSCFFCQYSDYSPYGNPSFGGMLCFRNIKEAYSRTSTKYELLEIHNCFERQVQETWLCPDFAPRVPGTGYRG
jgi:hypothetical protein